MSLTEAAAFEGVAGHSRALRLLESQLQRDHLAQAYLFTGEANLGKTEVARRLAKALLPEHPLERHPDYWEDDRGRAIPIDEIRLLPDRQPEFHAQSLQHFLSLKPAIATRRVALITGVGRRAGSALARTPGLGPASRPGRRRADSPRGLAGAPPGRDGRACRRRPAAGRRA